MYSEQCGTNLRVFGPTSADTCSGGNTVFIFMSLLNSLLRNTCQVSDPYSRILPRTVPDMQYDFVIIGSGTAGSTVAGRLAEVKHWKILLLEAGDDEPVGTQVPSFFTNYLNSNIDWNFKTEPEPIGCQGFPEKRCSWPRGKVLGGTSVINGMMFIRGTPKDYDKWVASGNTEWSYDKILDDFKSSENNQNIGLVDGDLHGTDGPVTIERYPYQPDLAWDLLKAGKEIGYNISNDLSGKHQTGFAIAQMNSRNGVRLSLAKAFVRPQRNNQNFHVMLNSTATKIVINHHNQVKFASAIEFMYNGRRHIVKVLKEVIVSAGAIQSPQLLLLSGIGDKETLGAAGIDQVHNLPAVGKGLKNHVSFQVPAFINIPEDNLLNMESLTQYLRDQTGPMSSTGISQVTARISSNYTTTEDPDIQFYFGGLLADCGNGLPRDLNNNDEPQSNTNPQRIYIYPTYLHSKSRGYIGLNSNDPFAPPKIVANYLSEPQDVRGLVAGIRIAQRLLNASILLDKYQTRLERLPYGTCETKHQWNTDEFWECAVKFQTGHENHQGSSCKMGRKNDGQSCVNQQLQLHGIENIRVIDASIFPDLPSANPQATIIMVAERGARFIKENYLNRIRRK